MLVRFKILALLALLAFQGVQTGSAQVQTEITMTPDEYKSLMGTIIEAKKRIYIRKKRIILLRRQAALRKQMASSPAWEADKKRIDQLELQFNSLQQNSGDSKASDSINKVRRELLLVEINRLKNRDANYYWNLEGNKTDSSKNIYNNSSYSYEANRYQSLEKKQKEEAERLRSDLYLINLRLDSMERGSGSWTSTTNTTNQNIDLLSYQETVDKQNSEIERLSKEVERLRIHENNLTELKVDSNNKNIDPQIRILSLKLADLESKIDQMEPNGNNHTHDHTGNQDVESLKGELAMLRSMLNGHSHPNNAPLILPSLDRPKMDLKTFVTTRRQQNVYFANASYQLSASERAKVISIAQWMSQYDLLDITIKGFASPAGNYAANQVLSQRRAEQVKKELQALGVRTGRITLQPLGIDSGSSASEARRAEIHLVIREN